MAMQSFGPISLDDISDEFGGTPPDSTNEYYRDGGLVTSNNTGIPTSGEISLSDFYSSVKQFAISLATGVNNATIANYFTPAEWNSATPKVFIVGSGVTVGSTSSGSPALRTGTTREGLAMGGTLKVVNNGYIYGAGGAVNSGTGGDAFIADVACSVDNTNGRMYSGGGGGGKGGEGVDVHYYPETTAYIVSPSLFNGLYYNYPWTTFAWEYGNQRVIAYWNYSGDGTGEGGTIADDPNWTPLQHLTPVGTVFTFGGYSYQMGNYMDPQPSNRQNTYFYTIRRRLSAIQYGGNGGNGGRGIGSNQTSTNGSSGSLSTYGGDGGNGGNGGGWGASGLSGAHGQDRWDTSRQVQVNPRTLGAGAGLAGRYIVGNASVTWLGNGLRLGRVA